MAPLECTAELGKREILSLPLISFTDGHESELRDPESSFNGTVSLSVQDLSDTSRQRGDFCRVMLWLSRQNRFPPLGDI